MAALRPPGWAPDYAARLVDWTRERAAVAGVQGAVVSVSGGVDSATVAALCQRAFPQGTLCLFLPCHSEPEDYACARLVVETFGLECQTIVLDDVYDRLVALMGGEDWSRLPPANLKVRLRTIVVYAYANQWGRLVAGTSNQCELHAGYFTKYGDGACDIAPLARLVKREVRELARELGVPERVIDRPPTAGLWPGQTDEAEMGLTYAVLDGYLRGEAVPPEAARRVEALHRASEHKRHPPLTPDF